MPLPETYRISSPASIEKYGKRLIGKTLREVQGIQKIPKKYLATEQGMKTKGAFGGILEEFYYGIKPPNDSNPDFLKAGVELKSTPLKRLKNGNLSAKERLVLNIINYNNESKHNFASSTFLKKNANIMLVAYLHEQQQLVVDYLIKVAELISLEKLSQADQIIIKRDWEKIINKIRAGHADELSEGDTLYLGACTKAANSKVFRDAPGNIRAKPRAFSFKQGFMTTLLNGLMDAEPVIKNTAELQRTDFETLVEERFGPFLGSSVAEIRKRVGHDLDPEAKGFFALLARRMMGVKHQKIEEFEKADVTMKAIRVGVNGVPREDISFPYFSYMNLIHEKWDETERGAGNPSRIKAALEKKFFFVVFQCGDDPNDIDAMWLKKVMFWNMPTKDFVEVKKVWQETIKRIKSGKADKLPRLTENNVAHVRPHAKNGSDKIETPHNGLQVKKSFWLNKRYIGQIIKN